MELNGFTGAFEGGSDETCIMSLCKQFKLYRSGKYFLKFTVLSISVGFANSIKMWLSAKESDFAILNFELYHYA